MKHYLGVGDTIVHRKSKGLHMWVFFVFVIVPIIEIALFIQLGGFLGFWPTIGLVILTALVGSILIRGQAAATMLRLRSSMVGQDELIDTLANGGMILVAGIVLVTPGFFTDTVGIALLLPPVRAWVIKAIGDRMVGEIFVQTNSPHSRPQDTGTIEGEYTRLDESDSDVRR
ncbi:MAG: FxsA family protein [Pseudomonadota bacterium]